MSATLPSTITSPSPPVGEASTTTPSTASYVLRAVHHDDFERILAIYRPNVIDSFISFEETVPDITELRARAAKIAALGLPYIVIEDRATKRVDGYAYASSFRERAAYRFTVESSVYVDAVAHGRGYGRILMETLIRLCRNDGRHVMIACIAEASSNTASTSLHRKLGFVQTGEMPNVGVKLGRSLSVTFFQLQLNPPLIPTTATTTISTASTNDSKQATPSVAVAPPSTKLPSWLTTDATIMPLVTGAVWTIYLTLADGTIVARRFPLRFIPPQQHPAVRLSSSLSTTGGDDDVINRLGIFVSDETGSSSSGTSGGSGVPITLPFASLTDVLVGAQSDLFKSASWLSSTSPSTSSTSSSSSSSSSSASSFVKPNDDQLLTLRGSGVTLNLAAPNADVRTKWLQAITAWCEHQ